jgi:hypothetical protein
MRGAIPPILQYAFMEWCSVKNKMKHRYSCVLIIAWKWKTMRHENGLTLKNMQWLKYKQHKNNNKKNAINTSPEQYDVSHRLHPWFLYTLSPLVFPLYQ